jgi:hypothetical protein
MKNTVLIELKNKNALNLLHNLEKMNIIEIIKEKKTTEKIKLSEKLKGLLTKEQEEDLKKYVATK